jgi:hypothetical protein
MDEEIREPEKPLADIMQDIQTLDKFKGMHQCTLCPDKLITSDVALKNHLSSRFHKKQLKQYFKKHEVELKTRVRKIKNQIQRNVLFRTRRYQKVANLAIHYKLLAQWQ